MVAFLNSVKSWDFLNVTYWIFFVFNPDEKLTQEPIFRRPGVPEQIWVKISVFYGITHLPALLASGNLSAENNWE
jgi:hypothetical protein